jgi:hypothetical protein
MRNPMSLAVSCVGLVLASPCLAASSPLDSVAAAEATRVFMAQRQTCGGKIVMALDVTPPQLSGFANVPGYKPLKPYTIYNEAIGLDRRLDGPGSNLTTADRMNGIEWKGRVHMVASSAREISVGSAGGTTASWTQWKANVTLAIVDLQRRNGAWEITVNESQTIRELGRFAQMRRAPCSEVPA